MVGGGVGEHQSPEPDHSTLAASVLGHRATSPELRQEAPGLLRLHRAPPTPSREGPPVLREGVPLQSFSALFLLKGGKKQ